MHLIYVVKRFGVFLRSQERRARVIAEQIDAARIDAEHLEAFVSRDLGHFQQRRVGLDRGRHVAAAQRL